MKTYTPENLKNEDVEKTLKNDKSFKVFLAGTIDNGDSDDWQKKVIEGIKKKEIKNITLLNPRRDNWDPKAGHDGVMKQIDWEQRCLNLCNMIVMVFLDTSKSPITFLELGLFAKSGKVFVFCTDKFYRYDNVLDTCQRYKVDMKETTDPKEIISQIAVKYMKK